MKIHVIGDPHLGRSFVNGVPLHRRGDREAMVWDQFQREVSTSGQDFVVCLGDLFNQAIVSYDLIVNTAELFKRAAKANPNCAYVILKGNHDYFRDLEKRSAFDVFTLLVDKEPNIICVDDRLFKAGTLAFIGYSVEHRADELVAQENFDGITTIFGHWDVESFGGDGHNLIPTGALPKGITAVTGHIHKPTTFERDGVHVVVHGSMQPYAHGEQVNDDLYVTVTPEELAAAGSEWAKNRCIRLIGLAPEDPVDCLQLTLMASRQTEDAQAVGEVTLGEFDMISLFKGTLAEERVPEDIQEKLLDTYHARTLNEAVS